MYTSRRLFLRIWHFTLRCWWELDDHPRASSANIQISKLINKYSKRSREDMGVLLSADISTSLKKKKKYKKDITCLLLRKNKEVYTKQWKPIANIRVKLCKNFLAMSADYSVLWLPLVLIAFTLFMYLLQHILMQNFFLDISVLFSKDSEAIDVVACIKLLWWGKYRCFIKDMAEMKRKYCSLNFPYRV